MSRTRHSFSYCLTNCWISAFILVIAMLSGAVAVPASAQIAFDAASYKDTSSTGNASISWSHTIGGGTNRALVIEVASYNSGNTCGSGAAQNVASVTYNGVAATAVPNSLACSTKSGSSGVNNTQLFYVLESSPLPAAGTYTVTVTFTGTAAAAAAGAISLAGVSQTAPEASAATAMNSGVTSISTSITTIASGAWLVDVVGSNSSSTWTVGSGQTQQWN